MSRYVHSIDKNIVADNIPAASARSEFPLPLHGPFDPTILLPSGVESSSIVVTTTTNNMS